MSIQQVDRPRHYPISRFRQVDFTQTARILMVRKLGKSGLDDQRVVRPNSDEVKAYRLVVSSMIQQDLPTWRQPHRNWASVWVTLEQDVCSCMAHNAATLYTQRLLTVILWRSIVRGTRNILD